jgi:hypothetical protein
MTFVVSPDDRARLRRDLLRERHTYSLTDAEFAADVLKISLNTYKKCVQDGDATPLRLKRQTFVSLFANGRLSPDAYGLTLPLPDHGARFGGYTREEFGFLAGHYVKYRRSFLTGRSFNRSSLELWWNATLGCLSFRERLNYVSDRGVAQSAEYGGEIYIHQDRRLMTLLSADAGEVRSALVHLPARPAANRTRAPFRLRGLQLAHAYPKGIYQPTVTPVLIEELAKGRKPAARQSGTIGEEDPDHARIAGEMAHTELHATVITSLVSRQGGGGSG